MTTITDYRTIDKEMWPTGWTWWKVLLTSTRSLALWRTSREQRHTWIFCHHQTAALRGPEGHWNIVIGAHVRGSHLVLEEKSRQVSILGCIYRKFDGFRAWGNAQQRGTKILKRYKYNNSTSQCECDLSLLKGYSARISYFTRRHNYVHDQTG